MRIAMWSGPRNLSTAMMYSFGNRSDCAVWDEPFYAAYLTATGLDHPMRVEILAAGERDGRLIAEQCLGEIPDGKAVFYQKHMTQHMVPQFDRAWMNLMTNIFLIRHPARVIASYQVKRENPTLDDIGFRQQAEIFEQVRNASGACPVVIDSDRLLENPEEVLGALCAAIGLKFQDSMLNWPEGGHKNDGAWADHWYGSVRQSTGFGKPNSVVPVLSGQENEILQRALPFYELMAEQHL